MRQYRLWAAVAAYFCTLTSAFSADLATKDVIDAYFAKRRALGERMAPLMGPYLQAKAANQSDQQQSAKALPTDQLKEWASIAGDLKLFADTGYAEAQYIFGLLTIDGVVVEQDSCKGLLLLHDAAAQAHAPAAHELASRYYFGKTLRQDRTRARLWAREAAHYDNNLVDIRDSTYDIAALDEKDTTGLKAWANWSATAEREEFRANGCSNLMR